MKLYYYIILIIISTISNRHSRFSITGCKLTVPNNMFQDLIATNNIESNIYIIEPYCRERVVEYNLYNELEAAKEALEVIKLLEI